MAGLTGPVHADEPPWLSLPEQISTDLRPLLPELVEELIALIGREVPAYARPMEGRFGDGVRRGVEVALNRFFDLPGTRESALTPASRQVYAALGRGEVRAQRPLEALLAAYRSGARFSFRSMARVTEECGHPTAVLIALGESVFAYIDELSAASVEGYALEQTHAATVFERRRADLATRLLGGVGDEGALRDAAVAAGWPVPDQLCAVVVPLSGADGLRLALGQSALVLDRESDAVALVAGPIARTALRRSLHGRGAAVGPARGWRQVPESLRLAQLAAFVVGSGVAQGSPVFAEDHLAEIVLAAEPAAIADLATHLLAPLDALRPAQRERLLETLLAWLRHHGQRTPMAAELHIHPQTVGYRVHQLRELYGAQLDDPDTRFGLELVLRSRTDLSPG